MALAVYKPYTSRGEQIKRKKCGRKIIWSDNVVLCATRCVVDEAETLSVTLNCQNSWDKFYVLVMFPMELLTYNFGVF